MYEYNSGYTECPLSGDVCQPGAQDYQSDSSRFFGHHDVFKKESQHEYEQAKITGN